MTSLHAAGSALCTLLFASAVATAPTATGPQEGGAETHVVRVAAAADLKFALDEIIAAIGDRDRSVRLEAIYGSSGSLHAQLRQRAPFDVYLSADVGYPSDLVSRGIGSRADLFAYATGHLVVWVPADSPLTIERDGMRALQHAARIAVANPRHAPYGKAAEAALRNAGMWGLVSRRLVVGENVAQAAHFVESGAADAGVLSKSLAVGSPMRTRGRSWDVPSRMHPPIVHGGLILPWAKRRAAERFRAFLLGADGRRILASHGFAPPSGRTHD